MLAVYPIKENYQKGCHLENIGHSDHIFDVHGVYINICTKYEVSMFKPVVRKAVHRRHKTMTTMMTTQEDKM